MFHIQNNTNKYNKMPSLQAHCEISKKRTGDSYEKLHKWIDNVNNEKSGNNPRFKRHFYSKELKQEVHKNFGAAGTAEWLYHIELDNSETPIPITQIVYSVK